MKIKCIRSIVKSIADMSVSNRGYTSFDTIIDNRIEEVDIDLVTGGCSAKCFSLPLVQDLSCWFKGQLVKEKINITEIESAIVKIEFDCHKVATNLEKIALLHISSYCKITANEKQLEANSYGKVWHDRKAA